MLTFKQFLAETIGKKGEEYQHEIYRVLFNAKRKIPLPKLNVPREKSKAYSSQGFGDIEAKYDNRFYNGIFVQLVGSGTIIGG